VKLPTKDNPETDKANTVSTTKTNRLKFPLPVIPVTMLLPTVQMLL
jgi:hypothetical protein